MQAFSKWLFFKVLKWKFCTEDFPEIKKLVLIIAPHTSNLDFLMGRLIYYVLGRKPHFLIKKQWFRFPIGWIIKSLGGVPIDRENSYRSIRDIIGHFQNNDEFILNITPEGTRSRVNRWKRGFYTIAINVNIPILPSYIDYRKKEIGIGKLFMPSGNYDEDMKYLKQFYKNRTARHPEKFNSDCIR